MEEKSKKKGCNAAAIVLAFCPDGSLILVLDPTKQDLHEGRQLRWKFSGGHVEEWDYPPGNRTDHARAAYSAGVRELLEETGAKVVLMKAFRRFVSQDGHVKTFFVACVDDSNLKARGNDGEYVKKFDPSRALRTRRFLKEHKNILREAIEYIRS